MYYQREREREGGLFGCWREITRCRNVVDMGNVHGRVIHAPDRSMGVDQVLTSHVRYVARLLVVGDFFIFLFFHIILYTYVAASIDFCVPFVLLIHNIK